MTGKKGFDPKTISSSIRALEHGKHSQAPQKNIIKCFCLVQTINCLKRLKCLRVQGLQRCLESEVYAGEGRTRGTPEER